MRNAEYDASTLQNLLDYQEELHYIKNPWWFVNWNELNFRVFPAVTPATRDTVAYTDPIDDDIF